MIPERGKWQVLTLELRVVPNDPDDDHVLAAALAATAHLIASGDTRHLLPLGHYEGIPIVNASEAVERLERGSTN